MSSNVSPIESSMTAFGANLDAADNAIFAEASNPSTTAGELAVLSLKAGIQSALLSAASNMGKDYTDGLSSAAQNMKSS
jgi:hypothetical protein